MDALLSSYLSVPVCNSITVLSSGTIVNAGYTSFRLRDGQFVLQQPWQKPSSVSSKRHLDGSPKEHAQQQQQQQPQQPALPTADTHSQQQQQQHMQTVLRAHQQLLEAVRAACAPTSAKVSEQPPHTAAYAAAPAAASTQDAAEAAAAADEAHAANVPAPQPEPAAAAANCEQVVTDWTVLAGMKHTLKPKLTFIYISTHGQQQTVQRKLFDAFICNPSSCEVTATAFDRQVLLPASCGFCMSDLKCMQPFVHAVQQRGSADLLVIDPPWENASARRSGRYATLTPNHLLHMPVKQLLKQERSSLVALWVTNRPRMHRFVREQLLPAWGLQLVATWLWLKVTDSGEPVSPLNSLHRHPWEQLWLARPLMTDAARREAQGLAIPGTTETGDNQMLQLAEPLTARRNNPEQEAVLAAAAAGNAGSACNAGGEQEPAEQQQQQQLQSMKEHKTGTPLLPALAGKATGVAPAGAAAAGEEADVAGAVPASSQPAQGAAVSSLVVQPPDLHVLVSVPGVHSRKPHLRQLLLPYVLQNTGAAAGCCDAPAAAGSSHAAAGSGSDGTLAAAVADDCHANAAGSTSPAVTAAAGACQQTQQLPHQLQAATAGGVQSATQHFRSSCQPVCVELFARELFPGWLSWGNECLKFQDITFWEPLQPGHATAQ